MAVDGRRSDGVYDEAAKAFAGLEDRCDALGYDDEQRSVFFDLIWDDSERASGKYARRARKKGI